MRGLDALMRKVQQKSNLKHSNVGRRTKGTNTHKEHGEVGSSTVQFSWVWTRSFFTQTHLPLFNQAECRIICREYSMSDFKRPVVLASYLVKNQSRSAQSEPSARTVANSTERQTKLLIKAGDECEINSVTYDLLSLRTIVTRGDRERRLDRLRCRVKPLYVTK